jgi:biotin carboxyl carrier protein
MPSPFSLPDLDGDYEPTPACRREFARSGHTRVNGLASPEEIAAYRPGLLEAAPKGRYDHRPLEERDTCGKAFVQMFNLWRHADAVRAFVFARRFAASAAALMGVKGVRLYHDQALFKEPGGGPTPWHQDQFYWPPRSGTAYPQMWYLAAHRAGRLAREPMGTNVEAQITGSVWKIEKAAGHRVAEGEEVLILASMKMEISVEAPCSGRISEIRVAEGDQVEEGAVLAGVGG